jgi:hypothetical protein
VNVDIWAEDLQDHGLNNRPTHLSIMRTAALYGTVALLITATIIFFTTKGTPEFAQDYIDSAEDFIDDHRSPKLSAQPAPEPPPSHFQPTHEGWVFDYKKHGRNYGLSDEQCNFAFPDLYREIDRAVEHRKTVVGNITPDETEVEWRGDGIVKAMIHDNQLYIIDPHKVWDHNHRPRALATLHSLHRAISAYPEKLPDIEFTFTVHDAALVEKDGNETTWAYTRLAHQEKLWLMPDFGLWGWPDVGLRSYAELQTLLEHEEQEFQHKIPKLVWRGSLDVGSKDVREGLVRQSEGRSWSDVQVLHWDNKTNIEERLLTMEDHCSYRFLAQTEGNTYSGRLKYLLNCHSILIAHELEWIELYHHLLRDSGPAQNYVSTKRDYSDLPKKMKKLLNPSHYDKTKLIADNAKSMFRERYLTPAAEACYWRALIRGWASVQDFTPQFWIEVDEYDKILQKNLTKRKPRGAPFEAYAIMEQIEWPIPAKPRKICIDE